MRAMPLFGQVVYARADPGVKDELEQTECGAGGVGAQGESGGRGEYDVQEVVRVRRDANQ